MVNLLRRIRRAMFNSATQFFGFDDETNRNVFVAIRQSGTGNPVVQSQDNADALATLGGSNALNVIGRGHRFNAITWDRERNNAESTPFASASRAVGTALSADLTVYNGKGIVLFVNITDVGAAGTLAIRVDIKDPVSGSYGILFTFSTDTASALRIKAVYPGIAVVAGANVAYESADRKTSRIVRIAGVVAGNAVTFSVGMTETE